MRKNKQKPQNVIELTLELTKIDDGIEIEDVKRFLEQTFDSVRVKSAKIFYATGHNTEESE